MEEQLKNLYINTFNQIPTSICALTPHGSQRTYYRIYSNNQSVIGTISTNTKENSLFIELSQYLQKNNIRVPTIYAFSEDCSIYLQEDFGKEDLFFLLIKNKQQYSLLTKAVDLLIQYQVSTEDWDYKKCYPFETFNTDEIDRDFKRFEDKFLIIKNIPYKKELLEKEKNILGKYILEIEEIEYVMMHRDFQARNILVQDDMYILIDYQNCRKGPIYYDLASLIFQSHINYTHTLRESIVEYYLLHTDFVLQNKHIFRKYVYLFGLIRIIQSIGSYGVAGLVENKEYFLDSIPFALVDLEHILTVLKDDFDIDFPHLAELVNESKKYFNTISLPLPLRRI